MKRIDADLSADITVSCGATGSGKSYFVKKELSEKKPNRLLIFDVSDEFGNEKIEVVYTIQQLYAKLAKNTHGAYRLVSGDVKKEFPEFCYLAKAWGNVSHGRLTVVIEEVGAVAHAGKAQNGQLELITQGRKYGISIYSIGQSIAEMDKTTFKQSTRIRIGRQSKKDQKYLVNELRLEDSDFEGFEGFDYMIYNNKNDEFEKIKV